MNNPLVTVVCLCFNQRLFVKQAIESVYKQTYQHIELIVLDDGSTDGSNEEIKILQNRFPFFRYIKNESNQGYCKSLNKAISYATGDFIIDLSADDILLPKRVEIGVDELNRNGQEYGVHFSDAELIDAVGNKMYVHSDRYSSDTIPQGYIYRDLIVSYFICSSSLMFRKKVIHEIGGYDERLSFEDFDFLIRASHSYKFCYTDEILVKKRIVNDSMSSKQFKRGSTQRWSTLEVCKKIEQMNRSAEEHIALKKRIRYEIGVCIRLLDFKLAVAFLKFYFRLSLSNIMLR